MSYFIEHLIMTDEMRIQQRPSALPYMLGGAAVGAGAGAVANMTVPYLKGTPMTHEDVVAEVNSKDKFEARTKESAEHADSWKDVKAKQDAVNTAQAELEVAKKGTPVDANISTELEAAKNARQAEFDKLLEAEKAKAGGTTVRNIPTAEEMRLGIKGDDASKVAKDFGYYNTTLNPEYENARKAVQTNPAVSGHAEYVNAQNARNSFQSSVETYYADVATNTTEKNPKTRTANARKLEKRLDTIASNEFRYPSKADIMKQAFKDGQMVEAKGRFSTIMPDYVHTWTDKKGVTHTQKFVLKDGVKYKELLAEARASVDTQRANLISEIKATEAEYISSKQNLDAFGKRTEFRPTGKKGGPNPAYVCDLADINRKDAVKTYTEQQRVMNKFLEGKKLSPKEQAILRSIESTFGHDPKTIAGSKKITAQLESRIALAQEYAGLNSAKKSAIGGQSRIALYETQMEEAIQSNKDVKAAAKKIKNLAKKYGINVETIATADETALKEIVEGKLKGSAIEDRLTRAQSAYDKAVTDGATKVDDKLVKAAEEKVTTAKGELEKAAKELGEKFAKGGKAKWIAPVAGAVVLGLAALGLRPSSNEA